MPNTDLEVDSIACIQFDLLEKSGETRVGDINAQVTYVPAIKCSEFYSDRMDKSSQDFDNTISREFNGSESNYICLDIDSFTLSDEPFAGRFLDRPVTRHDCQLMPIS